MTLATFDDGSRSIMRWAQGIEDAVTSPQTTRQATAVARTVDPVLPRSSTVDFVERQQRKSKLKLKIRLPEAPIMTMILPQPMRLQLRPQTPEPVCYSAASCVNQQPLLHAFPIRADW